jgi:uncharacterized damage-inducible protein DinB
MPISVDEITQVVTHLAETPRLLAAITNNHYQARLYHKSGGDTWSVQEILAHLRVCAEVWGKSILLMIAQDQPTVRYVSPRTVAKKRDYTTQDYQVSLQAFSTQRADLLKALQALEPPAWSRGATFTGTTKGREQTIFSYAQRIVDHEAEHLQ